MAYDIIKTIIWVMSTILSLATLHFGILAIVGIFAKKKYPKAKEHHRYGITISARNEGQVIGALIESCRKSNYPQDKLEIFVVAHNCTDNTAEIARKYGATVYEYNNEKEKTKGYALKYLFEQIEKDYGIKSFDGFFTFDADNILSKDFFEKMNDAFEAEGCKNIITSFRNAKNFGSNALSAVYGVYFLQGCRLEFRGRTVCNCSARISGCGYLIPAESVANGWNYVTLTEDWEFSSDQILQGRKIKYCDDAVFYDEQPTDFKVMWRQRVRWAKGHLLVCLTKWTELFRKIFSRKKVGENKNRFSAFDLMVNITPACIIYVVIAILELILTAVGSLIGGGSMAQLWIDYAISIGTGLAGTFVANILLCGLIFILEHKRIKNVSFGTKLGACLCYPIFQLLTTPMQIVALFSRNLAWKPIPHSDQTNFDTLNSETPIIEKEKVDVIDDDEVQAN